ncbi:unnamed protein product [Amoebophrya sp. A120]|nr:unnamed protein product [Amoebophrya sp. A120]|eukprot:GSA120T00017071001.1
MAQLERISFFAIGRVADEELLATWSSSTQGPSWDDVRLKTIRKLLTAARKRLTPGQRQKLHWDDQQVFVQLDFPAGAFVYVVVALKNLQGEDYPERIASILIKEMQEHAEANYSPAMQLFNPKTDASDPISEGMAQWFTDKAAEFDDPEEYDKLAKAMAKTSAIKKIMNDNVHGMLKNTENLNVLDEQAQAMRDEAQDYEEEADTIKDYFWWKDLKVTLLIALVVAIVIGISVWCCIKNCDKSKTVRDDTSTASGEQQEGGGRGPAAQAAAARQD